MFLRPDVEFHQCYDALKSENMRNKSLRSVLHSNMLVVNFFKSQTPFKTLEDKHGHYVSHKNLGDFYSPRLLQRIFMDPRVLKITA